MLSLSVVMQMTVFLVDIPPVLQVNNLVLFDQPTYDKLIAEVPKYKMITPSILSDRLRLNGSLARAGRVSEPAGIAVNLLNVAAVAGGAKWQGGGLIQWQR